MLMAKRRLEAEIALKQSGQHFIGYVAAEIGWEKLVDVENRVAANDSLVAIVTSVESLTDDIANRAIVMFKTFGNFCYSRVLNEGDQRCVDALPDVYHNASLLGGHLKYQSASPSSSPFEIDSYPPVIVKAMPDETDCIRLGVCVRDVTEFLQRFIIRKVIAPPRRQIPLCREACE